MLRRILTFAHPRMRSLALVANTGRPPRPVFHRFADRSKMTDTPLFPVILFGATPPAGTPF